MIYLFQNNKVAKVILSIIWGLALGSLFRKTCLDRNCIIFRAPDPKEVTSGTYEFGANNCYRFETEMANCGYDKTVND